MVGRELIFPKDVDNMKISEIWDFYQVVSENTPTSVSSDM